MGIFCLYSGASKVPSNIYNNISLVSLEISYLTDQTYSVTHTHRDTYRKRKRERDVQDVSRGTDRPIAQHCLFLTEYCCQCCYTITHNTHAHICTMHFKYLRTMALTITVKHWLLNINLNCDAFVTMSPHCEMLIDTI